MHGQSSLGSLHRSTAVQRVYVTSADSGARVGRSSNQVKTKASSSLLTKTSGTSGQYF